MEMQIHNAKRGRRLTISRTVATQVVIIDELVDIKR